MGYSRDFRAWYKMAFGSVLSEVLLPEKLVELWPEYSCFYDVRTRIKAEVSEISDIAPSLLSLFLKSEDHT